MCSLRWRSPTCTGTGAALRRDRPPFDRSRVDNPHAHRRLRLWHPLGAQTLSGSRASLWRTGGFASSILTTRFRTTRRSRKIVSDASERVICCATSSSASFGRRWRWGWSRAKASPSTPACSKCQPVSRQGARRTRLDRQAAPDTRGGRVSCRARRGGRSRSQSQAAEGDLTL
jgi:hypothetical protein